MTPTWFKLRVCSILLKLPNIQREGLVRSPLSGNNECILKVHFRACWFKICSFVLQNRSLLSFSIVEFLQF